MSAIIDDGGPAYPIQAHSFENNVWDAIPGMTLRDYFAGQALAGILAGMTPDDREVLSKYPPDVVTAMTSRAAFNNADAMIAARKGGPQS